MAIKRHIPISDKRADPVKLDPDKAELLRTFVENVGGIENARRALEVLAELQRRL